MTGDIYVAGATTSTVMNGNKTGVIQPAFAGGICDGYISIISNDGSTLKKDNLFGHGGDLTPSTELNLTKMDFPM
ncbi:MAG: hypothetical protein WDM78_10250 [Puia sp.]